MKMRHGQFIIQHWRDHQLVDMEVLDNTTTKTGFAELAGLAGEVTSGGFKWLALDESSTTATADDTGLAVECTTSGLTRVAATVTRVTTDNTNDTLQLEHTWTATGTKAIKGVGVFDTSTANAGVMLARTTFATKNLEANDQLKVTYKIKVA